MIKLAYATLGLLEAAVLYLFFQSSSADQSTMPPINPVYAGLLAMLNFLVIGVGVLTFKTRDSLKNLLHKMDKRLVRVETKLGINVDDE